VPFDLLETLRWTPRDGWYLLDRHLARLEASARHFEFRFSADRIRDALLSAVASADTPLRVRLLLADTGLARVECSPLEHDDRPWRVRLAEHPVNPTDEFLYHKTTNRAVYERARRPDCDDVILWNSSGEVTETTIANLVIAIEGRPVTPPIACGLLPGTLRAELLAIGVVTERVVTVGQLRAATGFWLVNSVRGWCTGMLID
jgi:branched-subunit amino acid aminotransferase/4-amino-4-deoxychorismate lyase